jgi:superfamily I DNA/RNA helicase
MNEPSAQQRDVIEETLSALSVIACAGSGKTFTAVRRLDAVRSLIDAGRGHVALLSFSNVAVNVFGKSYLDDIGVKTRGGGSRVCIETFDGFITTKVLRPHAHRTMKCSCMPYLLTGGESFLSNSKFQFWPKTGNKYPLDINSVEVEYKSGAVDFFVRFQKSAISIENAGATVSRIGEVGGYTHALGRYWAFEALRREPEILAALAHRYPQIIVDEAQDVGSIHIAILEMLAMAGSQITLVGDPNQAIFESAARMGDT